MKSLKIAICDDDRIQASIIEKLIEKIAVTKFINVDISVFYDGMTLKDYYRCHNSFDIVYLDIEMTSVLTYLYLTQLFFCFMPFHDILKRNGGDSLWQDLKHIILYSVTMKCQLFVRLLGIRKPVKPS